MLHQSQQELHRFAGSGHVVGIITSEPKVQSLLDAVVNSEFDVAKVQVMARDLGTTLQTRGAVRSGTSTLEGIAGTEAEAERYARAVTTGRIVVALPADNGYQRSQGKAILKEHGASDIHAFDANAAVVANA
jgi:hypothetical protein